MMFSSPPNTTNTHDPHHRTTTSPHHRITTSSHQHTNTPHRRLMSGSTWLMVMGKPRQTGTPRCLCHAILHNTLHHIPVCRTSSSHHLYAHWNIAPQAIPPSTV
ncbi:hypothetical protein E2C01_102653 [Portunus trituberculatus]|uniref:Uncharacterized protein n=1 Tax=Portunus trituberculatus TaxID=210409 RepID=A0A5B7KIV4_PORTR|nr:hypothetical protein [Portunus trituberculatus]